MVLSFIFYQFQQVSSASLGGAVFDDHQDRHGEVIAAAAAAAAASAAVVAAVPTAITHMFNSSLSLCLPSFFYVISFVSLAFLI
jgi:hypothetical protein